MTEPAESGASRIDSISTRASALNNPVKLVMRYGRALRKYLGALIHDVHQADDVSQDLLLQILHKGLARAAPARGRFRDYLKAVARNVALDHLHPNRPPALQGIDLTQVPVPAERLSAAESQWLADWRATVLEMAWKALELHQYKRPASCCFLVLRLASERPQESSDQLAARLSESVGRRVRADAFRKQLSRSRQLFAQFLVDEVRQTLEAPSPERIAEELSDLGLLPYVQPYLSPGPSDK